MCITRASGQLQCLNFRQQMAEPKLPLALRTCCTVQGNPNEIQKEKKARVVTKNTSLFGSVDLGTGDTCPDQSRPHCKFFGAISFLTITRVLTFFRLISTFV